MDMLEQTAETYHNLFDSSRADPEVKQSVTSFMSEHRTDIMLVLDEDSFKHWLLTELQLQVEAFRDEDGGRSKPVCSCNSSQCPLKRGRLPTAVRTAENMGVGIREFRQTHPGQPRVLDQKYEEWREKRSLAAECLETCVTAMAANTRVDELDSYEELVEA